MFLGEPAESQWKNTESLNVAGSLGPLASMHAVGPCFSACESMIEGPDGPELCISFTFPTPVYTGDQMKSFPPLLLNCCPQNIQNLEEETSVSLPKIRKIMA